MVCAAKFHTSAVVNSRGVNEDWDLVDSSGEGVGFHTKCRYSSGMDYISGSGEDSALSIPREQGAVVDFIITEVLGE